MRKIAIPVEHGGWGLVLEPIALGLAAHPSAAGTLLALGAFAAFFVRQPLKIGLVDRLRGRPYPRTATAFAVAAGFALLATLLAAGGLLLGGWRAAAAIALAAPLALVQIVFDARNDSRRALPEAAGAAAMSGAAAAIALGGGASWAFAAALWGIMIARSVPAILYVRARLRLEKGLPSSAAGPLALHAAAVAAAWWLVENGLAPLIAPTVFAALFVRCAVGLSPLRKPATAKRIGFTEVGWGTAAILALAIGYAMR